MTDPRSFLTSGYTPRTEHEILCAKLDSFARALTYLSTNGPHGAEYDWYFRNGVMSDVDYCLAFAEMTGFHLGRVSQ